MIGYAGTKLLKQIIIGNTEHYILVDILCLDLVSSQPSVDASERINYRHNSSRVTHLDRVIGRHREDDAML